MLAVQLPPPSDGLCRAITYNLLADQYTSQEYAQKVLFAHVSPEALDIHYRKQLILNQLLRSKADIMCLQEVDEKVFVQFLRPHLAAHGYSGIHACKAGQQAEGSATFFRSDRLQLVSRWFPSFSLAVSDSSFCPSLVVALAHVVNHCKCLNVCFACIESGQSLLKCSA
jgi:mRNA deadenylase 3'-5' endonuclease subunit Ccr4